MHDEAENYETSFLVIVPLIVPFLHFDSLVSHLVDLHCRSCRCSCLYWMSRPWNPAETNDIARKHVEVVGSGSDISSTSSVL